MSIYELSSAKFYVLTRLAQGHLPRKIAKELDLSIHTIYSYCDRIALILGCTIDKAVFTFHKTNLPDLKITTKKSTGLTRKQEEVLPYITMGLKYDEISAILGRNIPSIKNSLYNAEFKVGVKTRNEVVYWWLRICNPGYSISNPLPYKEKEPTC